MSTELVKAPDLLPPAKVELNENARAFIQQSLSANTRRAYAAQLKLWADYCARHGLAPFPASHEAVANWLSDRAVAGQANATLRTALAAVRFRQATFNAALPEKEQHPFDTKFPAIVHALRGAGKELAKEIRQAEPIKGAKIVELLDELGSSPLERRDAALLAIGYVFGLRRSELVALDYGQLGGGDGYIRIDSDYVTLVLVRSKTAVPGKPEKVAVTRPAVLKAVRAIEAWVALAGILPGEPLLRRVAKGGGVGRAVPHVNSEDETAGRLHPQSVALIIKRRLAEHYQRQGVPRATALKDAAKFSGHSLRVGFAVTAAEAGATIEQIALVTRHRSLEMPRRYSQAADEDKRSPYKINGVGTDHVPETKTDTDSQQ